MKPDFTIYGKMPSFNDYIEAERSHRLKGSRKRKSLIKEVCKAITLHNTKPKDRAPVMVKCDYYEPDNRRDVDNIVWVKKIIGDALVDCRILQNDSRKHIKGWYDTVLTDIANPRIEVTIIEGA